MDASSVEPNVSIGVWVYLRVEVSTDNGLHGSYWLAKHHVFPFPPPLGWELDYRRQVNETVSLDRIVYNPEDGSALGYQTAWISIDMGQLTLWEHAGWQKMEMTPEDKESA